MSEYTSYSVSATPGGAVRETLRRRGIFFHDDAAWQGAEERAEALRKEVRQALDSMSGRNGLAGMDEKMSLETTRLNCMLKSFCKVPAFKAFAEQGRSGDFEKLRGQIAALTYGSKKREPHQGLLEAVLSAQKTLEGFAASVQRDLCMAEKEAVLDTMASTLTQLGYVVEVKGDVLKATCDQMGVWARANEQGELGIDVSGFSGLSCMQELARIEERLRREGVRMRRTSSTPHGRPEGGVLVNNLRPLFPEFRKIEGKHGSAKTVISSKERSA